MKKYKLRNLIDVKRGCSLSGEYYSTKGDLIRLTLGNFQESCGFKENNSKDDIFFTGPVRDEFILNKGDIITPLTEQVPGLLGATARIPESGKYIQSGDVALVKCISNDLDDGYCYYLISSDIVRRQLGAAAQQTKIRHTSPEKIKDCIVFLPKKHEQIKIAQLLDNINCKIELNNAINDNLQHQLRILYDYWFTQFDFPNAEGKPYQSSGSYMKWNSLAKMQIPDGWEACSLKDAIQHIHTGLNPRDNFTLGNGNIKYVTVKNLTLNGSIDFKGCDTIDEDARRKVHNRSDIMIGDILFASIAPLGRCYLITTPPTNWDINESVFSIRPNNILSPEYLYAFLTSDRFIYSATNRSTGSIFKGIRINDLMDTKVIVPTADVLYAFSRFANKILMQKSIISQENEALLNQRNWILPMLMSGQATIAD